MGCIFLVLIWQHFVQCLRKKLVPQIVGIVDKPCQGGMLGSRTAWDEKHPRLVLQFVTPGYQIAVKGDAPSFRRLHLLQFGDLVVGVQIKPTSDHG